MCGLPTRQPLPGCAEVRGVVAARTIEDLWKKEEFGVHLTLHMQIGGMTDCAVDAPGLLADHPKLSHAAGYYLSIANSVYARALSTDFLRCPTACDAADAATPGACECWCSADAQIALWKNASAAGDTRVAYNTFTKAYAIWQAKLKIGNIMISTHEGNQTAVAFVRADRVGVGALAGFANDSRVLWVVDDDGRPATLGAMWSYMVWAIEVACHPGYLGQFASPLASPNDPIFWPIHVGFERYWSYLRLAPDSRAAFNNTWSDHTAGDGCRGWNMSDPLPFRDLAVDGAAGATGACGARAYNSIDLIELFAPQNVRLPYIWENFEWGHCTDDAHAHNEAD